MSFSHILTTGFVTRGQAEQSFRALGNTSLYKTMRVGLESITKFMRKNPGFKTGELSYKTEDEAEITLWGSAEGLFMVRVAFSVGGAIGLYSWLARCCVNCKLWEQPCVLQARGGTTGQTTFKLAAAILAVELVPGGTNLSPMLIDQAQDGEFR